MLSTKTFIEDLFKIAPEWQPVLSSHISDGQKGERALSPYDLFERLGAKAIYKKALALEAPRESFLKMVREFYLQPMTQKMVQSNQHLRRFAAQRRIPQDEIVRHALSFAVEVTEKLDAHLRKQIDRTSEDGFKVLLPAYAQRSVHNGVIDYIRQEWEWERSTLQDLNLDPEQEDPRQNTADDAVYIPENQAISKEQVEQLNQLRVLLKGMLGNKQVAQEPLLVLDLMFGLGMTGHSVTGKEVTMRECCDILKIPGETQARKIARCQVLLDKGLSMVREAIRDSLPGVADCWQSQTNVNKASRRELNQQLGLTENEVERLIVSRQYRALVLLVEKAVIKPPRLDEIKKRGAVAALVPVDINSATNRDLVDILGLGKESAARVVAARPFAHLSELTDKKLIDKDELKKALDRGAVLKTESAYTRFDLNSLPLDEIVSLGIDGDLANRLIRGRPFGTFAELEDYLCLEPGVTELLRQKCRLSV